MGLQSKHMGYNLLQPRFKITSEFCFGPIHAGPLGGLAAWRLGALEGLLLFVQICMERCQICKAHLNSSRHLVYRTKTMVRDGTTGKERWNRTWEKHWKMLYSLGSMLIFQWTLSSPPSEGAACKPASMATWEADASQILSLALAH